MRTIKQFRHNLHIQNFTLTSQDTDNGRYYTLPDGRLIPSVTTVLGWHKQDSLKEWRERVGEEEANKISSKAARRGTKLHNLCEKYLRNEEIDFNELDVGTIDLFDSIQHVLDDRVDDIYSIEDALYSEHLRLAGRVDCIANYNGKRSVIDFKTSNRAKKKEWIEDYFMQTACYAVMFEERTGIAIPNLAIIIAVENDLPQVFVERRDNWIDTAERVIKEYYDNHPS